MRNLCKMCLCLAVAALIAAPALAQPRPGIGGGFDRSNPTTLLAQPDVQKELKISDEQKEKITAASRKVREKMTEAFGKLRDLSAEDRQKEFAKLRTEMATETKKALDEVLKPEQTKRLKQIQLQVRGLAALNDPETQKALKISEEKAKEIKTLFEDRAKQIREETKDLNFRRDREKITEIRNKITKESDAKLARLLTTEQKEAWTEMQGEKLEIKWQNVRPGGGGRPGTRPGGNRPGRPGGTPPGGNRPPRIDL